MRKTLKPLRHRSSRRRRPAKRGSVLQAAGMDCTLALLAVQARRQPTAIAFGTVLVRAADRGRDGDTVGAATDELAGAPYGASALSRRGLEPLARREDIHGRTAPFRTPGLLEPRRLAAPGRWQLRPVLHWSCDGGRPRILIRCTSSRRKRRAWAGAYVAFRTRVRDSHFVPSAACWDR